MKQVVIHDVPLDLDVDEEWVEDAVNTSTLPSVIGNLTSFDVLTTDDTVDIQMVIDESGSLAALVHAMVAGVSDPDDGLVAELSKLQRSIREKMRITVTLFSDGVRQLHPMTPLFTGPKFKDINVPLLSLSNYHPSGMTDTISAVKQALADSLLYDKQMATPNVDSSTTHVMAVVTDGFVNLSSPTALAEIRRTIKKFALRESWTFLFFCVAEPGTVQMFEREASGVTDFEWYIELLIQNREFEDDSAPDSSGNMYSAREKAIAQIMFETMGTGWAFYSESQADLGSIQGDAGRIARLYLACENVINEEMLYGSYKGIGGFAFPAQNVSTIFIDPQSLAEMMGQQVSSSIARASVGLAATSTTSVDVDSDQNSQEDGDVF